MIEQNSGEYNIEGYRKTASTVFARGDVVTLTSGLLVRAGAATAKTAVLGLIMRDVLATDLDYAKESVVAVLILENNNNEFIADVTTGTAVQSMVGTYVDLANVSNINVSASSIGLFKVTKIVSTTKVVGRFSLAQ